MRDRIGECRLLIGANPLVLLASHVSESADRVVDNSRQVQRAV
jgi:hypothetical protein